MVSGERFEELRRIAFGRDSTAEERAVATEELHRLEEAQAAEARQTEARQAAVERDDPRSLANEPGVTERSDSVPREISPASDPLTPAAEADAPGPRRRTAVRAIWLVPIILASLAVGAIGGSLWGAAQQSTTKPSAHASFALGTDGSGQPGGDLAAAENTLAQPRTTQDVYPLPDVVQNQSEKQGWIKFGEPGLEVALARPIRRAMRWANACQAGVAGCQVRRQRPRRARSRARRARSDIDTRGISKRMMPATTGTAGGCATGAPLE